MGGGWRGTQGVHTFTHTFTHVHTRSHTFTHVHTRSHTFTHVHTLSHVHTRSHTFTHVHTRVHARSRTFTHVHARSLTFTYVFLYDVITWGKNKSSTHYYSDATVFTTKRARDFYHSTLSPSQEGSRDQRSFTRRRMSSKREVRAIHHHPVTTLTFTMSCLLPSRHSHWLRRFSTLSNNPKSTNLRRYVQDYSKIVIGKTNPTTKRFHTTTSVNPVQAHIHCYPLSPSTESE